MSQLTSWLLVLFFFEFALAMFLVFAARGMAWWKRLLGAGASLAFGIMFAASLYFAFSGRAGEMSEFPGAAIAFLLLFVNYFGFQLIWHLTHREEGFSCFGTIGRLLGCVIIGWLMFAVVVLGIASMIGLVGYLDR